MGNYITEELASDWLSSMVMVRLFDDNNDGTADIGPMLEAIEAAEQDFEAVAIRIYPDLTSLRAAASSCKFILRPVFIRACVERFPRAFGQGAQYWVERANSLMNDLRDGKIKLPIEGAPNPPANTGGRVELHGPEIVATDNEPVFTGGFGAF